jgi:hypothetical protein
MILLTAACNVAAADSISAFSDIFSPRVKGEPPAYLYSTRLTGVSYPWCSSFTTDRQPRKQPVHLFIPLEPPAPPHSSGFFDQTMDVISYLFRHLVLYKPPRKKW